MKKIAITLVALALLSASLSACERVPQSMAEDTTDAFTFATTSPEGEPQEPEKPDLTPETPVSLYEYEEVEDGIRITRYCGKENEVVIPESIDGKPVVELADTVFRNGDICPYWETIESITARSVKRVDSWTFSSLGSMKEFHMPLLEEVPGYAFCRCNALQVLDIPSVTKIEIYAFYNCSSLQTLELPVATKVDEYAFTNCSSLQTLELPAVEQIGMRAFFNCSSLQILKLPVATKVDEYAFLNCSSLQTLELPAVEQIGACAFYHCTFTELYLPNVTLLDEKVMVESGVRSLHGKVGSYAENWAKEHFLGFVDLENDYIPEYSDEPFNPYKYDFDDINYYKPTGISYAHNYGQRYLHIDAWGEYILVPDEFASWNGVAVYGDMGVLVKVVSVGEYTATRLSVVKFTRGSHSFEKYEIDLDEAIRVQSVFCNFVDSQTGFMFLFYWQDYKEIFLTLKTEDGGKTWHRIECPDSPFVRGKERPVIVKFVTDQVGIFSRSDVGDETMHYRTYLTADGGVTWDLLHYLPDPTGLCSYGATNLVDFEYIDGVYWLEYRSYVENELQILRYYSTDLILWRMEGDTSDLSGATNPYGIKPALLSSYSRIMKEQEALYGKYPCHLGGDFGSFTCVDLDGDGTDEVLIRSQETILILHQVNDSVYVYRVPLEELNEVDSNGVCYWHAENVSGAYRLSFTGSEYQRTELYRIENEGTEQVVYLIGEETVSEAVFRYLIAMKGKALHWYHQFCEHPTVYQPWDGK